MAIIILHAITGVCTPACLLAASIPVETVTPPLVGLALQRTISILPINFDASCCKLIYLLERRWYTQFLLDSKSTTMYT
ncbi:exported hypothetical protein [Candidatus Sulfotelmatobacter kueseliae]|uniref:Uncharacterized protein n=1 Tax=Candidatus Sulfotelmatobacter kueseliae TaxID=2042962 RepID=A0A2U3JZS2_9BACT|nr:exported hypothetical protein [Candidatus Sulfotelmatobacter kueseliae]